MKPGRKTPARSLKAFTQFDVPVSQVNEVFPAVVLVQAETNLHEGTPLRPFGFADEVQARFLRRAISLECITIDTRANDVLPGGRAATIPRHNMVKIQIFPVKGLPAILACVLIALEDVMAGELSLFFSRIIIYQPGNKIRHTK